MKASPELSLYLYTLKYILHDIAFCYRNMTFPTPKIGVKIAWVPKCIGVKRIRIQTQLGEFNNKARLINCDIVVSPDTNHT